MTIIKELNALHIGSAFFVIFCLVEGFDIVDERVVALGQGCLLYTSDAADE